MYASKSRRVLLIEDQEQHRRHAERNGQRDEQQLWSHALTVARRRKLLSVGEEVDR